jgi:hypothetical protein
MPVYHFSIKYQNQQFKGTLDEEGRVWVTDEKGELHTDTMAKATTNHDKAKEIAYVILLKLHMNLK